MKYIIRYATTEDAPSIARLHHSFLQDKAFIQNRVPSICECSTLDISQEEVETDILEEMNDPDYSHIIALDQNKVIGYMVLISIEEMDDLLLYCTPSVGINNHKIKVISLLLSLK